MSTATETGRKWIAIKGKCPSCGHGGWCTRSADGLVVKCMRNTAGRPIRQKDGETAYLFRADKLDAKFAPVSATSGKVKVRLTESEIKARLKRNKTAVNPRRLDTLSKTLGVSVASLKAYGIGFDAESGCWSFPMFDGDRKPIGIRLRRDDGRKLCVPGSRNGLFIPDDYDVQPIPEGWASDPFPLLVLLPEGPTDCAASRDLGFRAVGRPSAKGGADLMRRLLQVTCPQEVVVVADKDETKFLLSGEPFWPGIEGAVSLAEQILPACGRLRFMVPPDDAKDLRAWMNVGNHGRLLDAITKCPVVDSRWLRAAAQRLSERRRTERRAPAA